MDSSHQSRSVEKLFEEVLYTPLLLPEKVVRLARDSLLDHKQRASSASIAIGELYHENSKLFREILSEIRALQLDADEFRREFVRRRAASSTACIPMELANSRLKSLLLGLARSTDITLFYAIQVCVIVEGKVAVHEPISDTLGVYKQLSLDDLEHLRAAFRPTLVVGEPRQCDGWLVLSGAFGRNEILLGRRGYRRTLLEAGQVAEQIRIQALQLGLACHPVFEFIDRSVDELLDCDGTEIGTLLAFEVGGGS